jgi:DNA replication protein DnaD
VRHFELEQDESGQTLENLNAQTSEKTDINHYKYITGLNRTHKLALYKYQKSSSRLNRLLRFDFVFDTRENDILNDIQYIRSLRHIIKNAPTFDKDIVVYRGDSFTKHFEVGEYVNFNTFLSTSTLPLQTTKFTEGACCVLEMTIPKESCIGLLMYTMPYVEEYRQESEVLLLNGTKWLVTKTGYITINNVQYKKFKLKFVETNDTVFTKYCSSHVEKVMSNKSIKELIKKCAKEVSKECNIITSSVRLGYMANTTEEINNLCVTIQSNRNLKFKDNISELPHEMCVVNKSLSNYRIKSLLGQGTAGNVYKACDCTGDICNNNNCMAIKQTPIWNDDEIKLSNEFYSERAMKYQSWVEIVANTLVTTLISQSICPNFVGLYHWFYCTEAAANKQLGSEFDKCVYLVNEVANYGTLQKWINKPRSRKEMLSMTFQVFVGLYSMKHQFNMIHGDLHSENVLVISSRERRTTYSEYILNNTSYYIPDNGYQFLIADFGRAFIKGKMEIEYHTNESKWYEKEMKQYNTDLYNLDWAKFVNSLDNGFIPLTKESFLNLIEQEFSNVPEGYNRNATYNLDKRATVDKNLQRFCNKF